MWWNIQFSSVTQSCLTLCDPMNHSMSGLPVHYQLPEFIQTHVHRVGDAISHLILCCPLLLLPPIPPSVRVFSSDSTLPVRWPKYWSFSFSISPSNEHPGLISFRMDWLDLLAVQGTSAISSVHFSQSCLTLCDPMNCSMLGLPAHHHLLEFTQTHVHWVGDAIQPSHPLSSPPPPAPNPSQHQGLFQWVNSLHEVAKVLEFQL